MKYSNNFTHRLYRDGRDWLSLKSRTSHRSARVAANRLMLKALSTLRFQEAV